MYATNCWFHIKALMFLDNRHNLCRSIELVVSHNWTLLLIIVVLFVRLYGENLALE